MTSAPGRWMLPTNTQIKLNLSYALVTFRVGWQLQRGQQSDWKTVGITHSRTEAGSCLFCVFLLSMFFSTALSTRCISTKPPSNSRKLLRSRARHPTPSLTRERTSLALFTKDTKKKIVKTRKRGSGPITNSSPSDPGQESPCDWNANSKGVRVLGRQPPFNLKEKMETQKRRRCTRRCSLTRTCWWTDNLTPLRTAGWRGSISLHL